MQNHHNIPFIAIVGRPNVGKSTLFNRLVGKKIAITDSIPGSTRDIIEQRIYLDDRPILIADTGGRRDQSESTLESLAVERSYTVDESATLLLFLLEAHQILAEDHQLIEYLRQYQHKVILVVNKCDSTERDLMASNYYQLGFEHLIMISAEHGRNIDALKELLFSQLPTYKAEDEDPEERPEGIQPIRIAILGKPNAGKSTLANNLSNSKKSLVSSEAGTTRDSIKSLFVYREQPYLLIDTAGLRKRARVNEPIEFYATRRAESAIVEADVTLLLIDAALGLTDQDKKIADKIIKAEKPLIFVLNKIDLLEFHDFYKYQKGNKLKMAIQDLRDNFPLLDYLEVVGIQADNQEGLDKLMKSLWRVYQQNNTKISDADLQRALPFWLHDNPISGGSRYAKIKSIRQISTAPPKFIARFQGTIPTNYLRYIKNCIQKEFNLNLVPITLEADNA